MQKIYMIDRENDRIDRWYLQRIFHRLPLNSIEGLQVYKTKGSAENIDIYLLDSKVDLDHPEFLEAASTVRHIGDPNDDSPTNDHATALASLIVGKNLGVAPKANLIVCSCFNQNGRSDSENLRDALREIIKDRSQALKGNPELKTAVCCLPLITHDPEVQTEVKQLLELNVLCIAASGDRNKTQDEYFPAALDEVLTVCAMNKTDEPAKDFAIVIGNQNRLASTNLGDAVDMMAPGIDITVADRTGDYKTCSGSSVAAAVTAALAAHFVDDNSEGALALKEQILRATTQSNNSCHPPIAFYPYHSAPFRWIGKLYAGVYSPGDKIEFPMVFEVLETEGNMEIEMSCGDIPFQIEMTNNTLIGTVPEELVVDKAMNYLVSLKMTLNGYFREVKLTLRVVPKGQKERYQELHEGQVAIKSLPFPIATNPNLPSNAC